MIISGSDILSSISSQIKKLMEEVKFDIINLNQAEDYNEKTKIQKILTENLQKILSITEKIKKVEKLFLEEKGGEDLEDEKILEEFISKIKKQNSKK